jgi:hypothetical protein
VESFGFHVLKETFSVTAEDQTAALEAAGRACKAMAATLAAPLGALLQDSCRGAHVGGEERVAGGLLSRSSCREEEGVWRERRSREKQG